MLCAIYAEQMSQILPTNPLGPLSPASPLSPKDNSITAGLCS